jgi:hypothetical protein
MYACKRNSSRQHPTEDSFADSKENLKTLLHVIQVILHLAIESDVDRKQC